MAARLAILCPGQGAQHPGMFALAGADPAIASKARDWLAAPLAGLRLDDVLADPARPFDNRLAQPLIVAAAAAAWEALRARLPEPAVTIGYSVGELSAWAVGGAIAPEAAVALAAQRASLMQACVDDAAPQAMLSVGGLDGAATSAMAARHGMHVAIKAADDLQIVGGFADAADDLQAEAQGQGARSVRLPIGVASHTPLMRAAVAPFADALRAAAPIAPFIPVPAGISGEAHADPAAMQDALARQIDTTIRWTACLDACAERGVTVALELGPGNALSRMLHARHPRIDCRSTDEFRTVDGLLRWLDNRLSG